jgi:type I restriction enzyme M protein
MLTSDVKRRIDAARDVLVGVAPNPTTQIEQITFALIYKFMHDMDQSAVKAGGEASFFTGTLKKYSWDKVLDSRLGNHEKLALYAEALEKFTEAKQLPELFRSIFRSAYLPYKSPETLGLFLKEMNHFDYTHPEELGNAYEYLLSIMSSQGDAGQFRTPRHIIDFMVDVINPSKDDRILDPACGTGGFLISSYKHILEQHDGKNDPKKKEKPLTPDDRKKLMANLEGYDIDPTMVRIAQVNMYLHQFKNPQIFQYDTLTSEERWNNKYDVILANPPFMSPRGGIRPHNKFGVSSNRAEVLFVDYIINHLKPKGRAGIVVPEGVIFQSGNAYKALRKNLVENGLFAVVSLPGGVFQPYSGVKTNILLLDTEIAKKKSDIIFVKISADGFDLGATKRATKRNDLPEALSAINVWMKNGIVESSLVTSVSKLDISATPEYVLVGGRYSETIDHSNLTWPVVKLNSVCNLVRGVTFSKKDETDSIEQGVLTASNLKLDGTIDFREIKFVSSNIKFKDSQKLLAGDIFICLASGSQAHVGKVAYVTSHLGLYFGGFMGAVRAETHLINTRYLYFLLRNFKFNDYLSSAISGANIKNLSAEILGNYEIPLPPLEVQEQIVAELDGYAAIIDGAKQIVDNWKPRIDIDPDWERRELGDVCEVYQPKTITGAEILDDGPFKVYGANGVIGYYEKFNHPEAEVAITCRGATCGTVNFTEPESWITGNAMVVSPKDKTISKKFLQYLLIGTDLNPVITGSAQPQITGASLKPFEIPVPPINVQGEIIKSIDSEASQVNSAKQLIEIYETRTKFVIQKLWSAVGEDD